MLIVLIISIIIVIGLFLYVLWLKGQIFTQAQEHAQDHFKAWRERELESLRKELQDVAQRQALTDLDRWKNQCEKSIRQDAIQKSQAVTTGKVTEQLVPYLPHFRYNPQDARFIGSPVDFIVFDGMTEGKVQQVVFLEVKTGSSSMSKIQKQVRDIIDARTIKWEELRLDIKQVSPLLSG